MADRIEYCDKCGKIIRPSEIAEGRARIDENLALCVECAASLPPPKEQSSKRAAAASSNRLRVSSRGTPSKRVGRQGAAGASPKTLLIVSIVFGVTIGLVVSISVLPRSEEPNPASSLARPALDPIAVVERNAAESVGGAASGGGLWDSDISQEPSTHTSTAADAPALAPTDGASHSDPVVLEKGTAEPSIVSNSAPEMLPETTAVAASESPGTAAPEGPDAPEAKQVVTVPSNSPSAPGKAAATRTPKPESPAVEPTRWKNGLVAHWEFDEVDGIEALDSSGNRNNGVLRPVARFDPGGGLLGRGALYQKGGGWSTEAVDCGNAESLDVGSLTFALWLKPESITTDPPRGNGIVSKWAYHEAPQSGGWGLHLLHDGSVGFFLDGMDTAKSPPNACKLGEWRHVAATYDQHAKVAKLYINGTCVDTKTGTMTKPAANIKIMFGRSTQWPSWFHGWMNDARLYDRALPANEVAVLATWLDRKLAGVAATQKDRERLIMEASSDPEADGYYLTAQVVVRLAELHDAEKTTGKRLALIGGTLASRASFSRGIQSALPKTKGYTLAGTMGLVRRGQTIEKAIGSSARPLAREKPELVRIVFDVADLARERQFPAIRADLSALILLVTRQGAVPVLYTIPMRRPTDDADTLQRLTYYNDMVMDVAREEKVPCVDAWRILNAPDADAKRYFGASGAIARNGQDAIDEAFLEMYRVIERWVFRRGVLQDSLAEARVTTGAETGSEAGTAAETRTDTAANLVSNGGFEDVREQGGLASGWTARNWGEPRSQFAVRRSRSNVHGGEWALLLLALAEDAQPGAFTALALEPGTYELTYWACAEVDAPGRISAQLADHDIQSHPVGDDWQQFVHTIVISAPDDKETRTGPRPKPKPTTLKIWTTTRMRVWLDDVSVISLGRKR